MLILPKRSKRHLALYKGRAKLLVESRLAHFNNNFYNSKLQWKKVGIRNQKTRWGSCSKRGNLQFNYRIVFLPTEIADYLVVHELCHLGEFNHSHKFWDLVQVAIPDFKERAAQLRKVRSV